MSAFFRAALVLLLGISPLLGQAETNNDAVERLEATWKKETGSQLFSERYWKLSGELAAKFGTSLLGPILARSSTWKGEEGLIFAAAVVQIDPKQAAPVLERIKAGKDKAQSIWANEYLIEIEAYQTAKREGRPYQ